MPVLFIITDGTAAISITVQVVALIEEASLIAPAAMPPTIPPTSKSVESMALISAPVPAEKQFNVLVTSYVILPECRSFICFLCKFPYKHCECREAASKGMCSSPALQRIGTD